MAQALNKLWKEVSYQVKLIFYVGRKKDNLKMSVT